MRLHELAKELNKSSAELLALATQAGLGVKNRLSGLKDDQIVALRKACGRVVPPAAPAAARPALAQKAPKRAPRAHRPASAPARAPAPTPPLAPAPAARPAAPRHVAGPMVPGMAPEVKARVIPDLKKKAQEEGEAARAAARKKGKGSKGGAADAESLADVLPVPVPVGRFIPPSTIPRYPHRNMHRQRGRGSYRPAAVAVERQGPVTVQTPISIKEFSAITGVKANQIILNLMQQGGMFTINAVLARDQVEALARDFKLNLEIREAATAESAVTAIEAETSRPEDLKPRPPVVTFLGHVDHGKTSLLDCIRKTDKAAHEFGGITQHIGAHTVTKGDKTVVFLDTPGHEAFTAMRARGANVTDIATLIVAADDGVMPQTEEALDHAKAAGVPIVVAVNKCDKPEANPARVRQQLSALGVQPEEWGGDTVFVDVSAVTGKGVDDLLEMLSLVAELKELKANPDKPGRGTVLEAQMSGSRGPMATVLVQDGSIRVGDIIVCGAAFGRVKSLDDDHNRPLQKAGPSMPVAVSGLSALPEAGDRMIVMGDLQQARAVAEERQYKAREAATIRRTHVNLENLYTEIESGQVRELLLILKADVRGSLEAVHKLIGDIQATEVKIHILRASVGGITTSDVLLADASNAIIVGMNVTPDSAARALAEQKGVGIRTYNVIYRVKEEIEKALVGMLTPEEREVIGGHAEVRRIFRVSKFGVIAGCFVRDGVIARSHRVRLVRDGVVVHQGRIGSLRRVKDDVREVREGFECGIHIESYDDIKAGDIIETFTVEKIARTLGSATGA